MIDSWSGNVSTINFANNLYNREHSQIWGQAELAPLFEPQDSDEAQENWTALFTGFVRISDPGAYNFSVLNDDGFYFRLTGANGRAVSIGRDFLNARDRNGLAEDVTLDIGLYGFELGFWNRLQAGVVDLRWQSPGSTSWERVPAEHLAPTIAPPRAVPAPSTLALAGVVLGLLALGGRRTTRR